MSEPAEYVVLDTDVASLALKRRSPAPLLAQLAGKPVCISFVTYGELTQWATIRQWGTQRHATLNRCLADIPVLPCGKDVARRWGEISGYAKLRGRPRPQNDSWIAATCLTYELPLATLNTKDFRDFVEHEGLRLTVGQEPDQ